MHGHWSHSNLRLIFFGTDDSVYLEDDTQREEYIENDKGKVYVGQYRKPRGRSWAFGQFDDVVLPAAVYLLETRVSNVLHSERGNPVKVVRAISAAVSFIYGQQIVGQQYFKCTFINMC